MSDEYKVQWSAKYGAGHLLNVRANDVDELLSLVNEVTEKAGTILIAASEEIAAKAAVVGAFPKAEEVKPVATPAGSANPGLCAHGKPYKYQEGNKKTGGTYQAWFCTVENDPVMPKCKAIWL